MGNMYVADTLPTTSLAAIREFNDRYLAAQATYEPDVWSDRLCMFEGTNSPLTTFPVSALGLAFQPTRGESRFKKALEDSFDVKTVEFDEGYEAPLRDLMLSVFQYRRWQEAPKLLTIAEARFRVQQIAALLEAGASTTCYDGTYYFNATHPVDKHDSSKGTYSNYNASVLDVVSVANIEAQIALMQENTKDENGAKIAVDSSQISIGVPTAKYEPLKNLLLKEQIASAAGTASETNPYAGKLEVVHMPELTDANDWFLFNRALAQYCPPAIALKENVAASLALRNYDESSDLFRDTGKLRVSAHIWYGFALAFPQAIRLVKGA